jgi:pilus assembly protein TadC
MTSVSRRVLRLIAIVVNRGMAASDVCQTSSSA